MLTLALPTQIYLCAAPTDMRKSFDSLAAIVRDHLKHDPFVGHLFVFRSKRQDRIKLLYWDADGYAIWMKRLEKGTFQFPVAPTPADSASLSITATELALILGGIDLNSAKRRPRYHRPEPTAT
jgi:transposase